jgi:protein-S-isoprenylcysteine O-methyltransferase Ste14
MARSTTNGLLTGQSSDSPGVIAFPPMLYGTAFAIGLILHFLLPIGRLPSLPARLLGLFLILASGALAIPAKRAMRRAGTNINPNQPATAVVTDGPFRFTRNPLYLSLAALYAGIALLINAVWPLVWFVPLMTLVHWGVVRREERYLEAKFGDAYRAYKARVRRWI